MAELYRVTYDAQGNPTRLYPSEDPVKQAAYDNATHTCVLMEHPSLNCMEKNINNGESMKLSEEDLKDAEDHATLWYYDADGRKRSGGINPARYDSYLAGIERERKRIYSRVEVDKDAIAASKLDQQAFIERVGERHWRIKDGT